MIKSPQTIFHQDGIWVGFLPLPPEVPIWVQNRKYQKIDEWGHMQLSPKGELRKFLSQFGDFRQTEHILSLREAPHDEDGIWHDDSSRLFAFSWALTPKACDVIGGELLFRRFSGPNTQNEDTETISIKALEAGGLIVFKTGQFGYEHKVSQVKQGMRLVFTGWLS